jgi:hypothetical protein
MKTTLRDQVKGRLEDLKGKILEIASAILGKHAPEGKGTVRRTGVGPSRPGRPAKVPGR